MKGLGNFDVVQWVIEKDTMMRSVTWLNIGVLENNSGVWMMKSFAEMLPSKDYINGGEKVVAEKMQTVETRSGNADIKTSGPIPELENVYMMHGTPHSVLIDTKSCFFEPYWHIDGVDAFLMKHFRNARREFTSVPRSGCVKLPYTASRGFISDVLKYLAEQDHNKRRFMDDLNLFISSQVKKRQK